MGQHRWARWVRGRPGSVGRVCATLRARHGCPALRGASAVRRIPRRSVLLQAGYGAQASLGRYVAPGEGRLLATARVTANPVS